MTQWQELLQLPEERIPLDEAALLVSACANPDLDLPLALGHIDQLADKVDGADADAVCRLLFDHLGFAGDTEHYDDPANSYLDRVVERRSGIPISLSVLLIEVGRRRGVPLEAVGMPGHFLVRDPARPDVLIDAFHGGRRLDRPACEQLLRAVAGGSARLSADMLAAVGPRAILRRMLLNLDRSFERRDDHRSLAWATSLRAAIPGGPPGDLAQLASRLAALGRFDAAAGLLEQFADGVSAGPTRDRMLADATGLRARLN